MLQIKITLIMWIHRNYIEKIDEALKTRPVIILTGIRQSGKSSLLQKYIKKGTYYTLDNVTTVEEIENNAAYFLEKQTGTVIIDEIQYAPSIFRDIKMIVDANRQDYGRWVLTGSQVFGLMKGVTESLAGRARILQLWPLSSDELNNTKLLKNKADMLWRGGYPEVWAANLKTKDFFTDYIHTYLERDIKDIVNVRNMRDYRRFLNTLALRAGQIINYTNIANDLNVSLNTIKEWLSTLEISGVISLLPPYYSNLGKRLIKAPKLYFNDNGLLCHLLNIHSLEALEASPLNGAIWENFVFVELAKNEFEVGNNLFYLRDQNAVEIDFIVERDTKTWLIEAKNNERPNKSRLNFRKIAPLFDKEVNCVVACRTRDPLNQRLKDYTLSNPLFGFNLLK